MELAVTMKRKFSVIQLANINLFIANLKLIINSIYNNY